MKNPDQASGERSAVEQERARVGQLHAALQEWEAFGRALPHELMGPLSVLDAFAALLDEREAHRLSERGRLMLDRLRSASLHARSLATGLLVLAPLSLHPLTSVPVDLSALAREIMELELAAAPARQALITIQPGLTASGDPHLLRSLVANLLGNAWKYSATRQQAQIEFGLVPVANAEPAFCVRDNGVGFPMEYADDLFQPFKRLHTSSEFEGVGLGLLIARRVVERHGGSIWAEAVPDEGARMFFRLGSL
jgi:light-regulated signal transduction histidine kinase (bacteriophytochrome)